MVCPDAGGPRKIYLDPSPESTHLQLRDDRVRVEDADNTVVPDIKSVDSLLASGGSSSPTPCERLLEEFPTYMWDEKAPTWMSQDGLVVDRVETTVSRTVVTDTRSGEALEDHDGL